MAIDTIRRTPGLLQLELVEDDDATWQLTFVDSDSVAVDVSSSTWTAQIITPRDVTAATITVDAASAASGILTLSISDTLTDGLGGDKLRWELVEETTSGLFHTVLSGPCIVHKPGYGGVATTPTNAATVVYDQATVAVVSATDLSGFDQLNIDGGHADTIYGDLPSIDGGDA